MSQTPMMPRQHFVAIAKVLESQRPGSFGRGRRDRMILWMDTVDSFATMLATTNPQFNRAKFLDACGYNEDAV